MLMEKTKRMLPALIQSRSLICLAVMALLSFWGVDAMAQSGGSQSFGDVGETGADNGSGISQGIWVVSLIVGFALVVFGLMKVGSAHKNREGTAIPFTMVSIGAVMMAVTVVIGIAQTSFLGDDESSGAFDELDLNQ